MGPTPGTSRTSGVPEFSGVPGLGTTRTLGPSGTSGTIDPWGIPSTIRTSEPKHPETLKRKHTQKTSLSYVIEQS